MSTTTSSAPTKVTVDKSDVLIFTGKTNDVTVGVEPSDADQTVDVTTDDELTATVAKSTSGGNNSYTITGVKPGTATITFAAHADNTKKITTNVTITDVPTKITLDPTSAEVIEGKTATIVGTIEPATARQRFDFTAGDDSIVSIGEGGDGKTFTINGLKAGSTDITFAAFDLNTVTAKATIKVDPKPAPTKVTVDNATVTIDSGKTANVVPTIEPDGADQTVDATTSNDKVATVKLADDKKSYVITPTGVGTATVTFAAHADATKKVDVGVTVNPPAATKIDLDNATLSLIVGAKGNIVPKIEPDGADQAVDVSTSDDKTATVKLADDKKSYEVTAVKAGTANIVFAAHSNNKITATSAVTVALPAATKVNVDKATLAITTGDKGNVVPTIDPAGADQTIDASTSDDKTATVALSADNKTFIVSGVKAGTATITFAAHSNNKITTTTAVTVADPIPGVTKVDVDKTTLAITTGSKGNVAVSAEPANADQAIDASTSDDKTATVKLADDKKSFEVSGVKAGTATITFAAHSDNSKKATTAVTITDPVPAATKVDVTPATLALDTGATGNVTVKIEPDGADQAVDASTSDDKTATVALSSDKKSYVVTAVKAGTATITFAAHSDNTKKATVAVTNTDPKPAPTKVDVTPTTLALETGKTGSVTAKIEPDGADQTLDVTTSDDKTATVALSQDKKSYTVTAVKAGTATLTFASHADNTKKATVAVTNADAKPAPTKVDVTPATLTVGVGAEAGITVGVEPAGADQTTDITSSDATIVTVKKAPDGVNCIATGVKAGTATITVASHADATKKNTVAVTVVAEAPAPTKVDVSPTTISLPATTEAGIIVQVEPAGANQAVDATSSDETVATLKKAPDGVNYVVVGVKKGTATLTFAAHADNTKKNTVAVTVTDAPKGGDVNWALMCVAMTCYPHLA